MAEKIQLSVVIPAYKESSNLDKGALDEVYEFLKDQKYSYEVLVVDDGSPDDTADKAEKITKSWKGFKVLREPHRGKGGTVIAGILKAKGEIVLFTDMDQATPITEVTKFFPEFKKGSDIVIGSRAGRKGAPLTRKMMAYGFMILRTLILRLPYKDTQCGFKAFTNKAAQEIFGTMKEYLERSPENAAVTAGFDLEFLYIARKKRMKVKEVQVKWTHKGTDRVNPFRDSIDAIQDMMRVRINALMGKYKV